jgi:phage repressor protein C with HTH and peptisase S24 domain
MEFCERLKWAREKAGYSSPRAAAIAFGWNENTYKSHENGMRGKKDRPPSEDYVKKYAARFKVDFIWLLTGHGSPARRSVAKVMGRIGAGAEISPEFEQVPSEGLYEIESSVPLPPEMIGFEVVGDSMIPRYDEGDVIICPAPGISLAQVVDGEELAVRTADGRRFLKKAYREDGAWRLESHNAKPIQNIQIEWASDIWTVVRSRKWKKINGK